jgi:hypothetical protein
MTWKPAPEDNRPRSIASAALERLEAERKARIQAKIDSGQAIRAQFPIVVVVLDPQKD